MPREERAVYFSFPEVHNAIQTLCEQREMEEPAQGRLTEIVLPGKQEKTAWFAFEGDDGTVTKQEYPVNFVAASLILACRHFKIPLPKRARKTLHLLPDSLGLVMNL
jgi:hypothetical protein